MHANLISILIPVYKDAHYLRACIDSILQQNYPHFEALFLLNGLEDDCDKILESYNDTRIKIFSLAKNIHAGPALVHLLGKAKGAYIKPFCADDIMLPHCLEDLHRAFVENPGTAIVFANSVTMGERATIAPNNIIYSQEMASLPELVDYILSHGNPYLYPPTMFLASELPNMRFDIRFRLVFDLLIWLSLLMQGKKYVHLERPITAYRLRQHSGNTVSYLNRKRLSLHCFEYEMLLELFPEITAKDYYNEFSIHFQKTLGKKMHIENELQFSAAFALYVLNKEHLNNLNIDLFKKAALRMLFKAFADKETTQWLADADYTIFDYRKVTSTYYDEIRLSGFAKFINKFCEYYEKFGFMAAVRRTYYYLVRY